MCVLCVCVGGGGAGGTATHLSLPLSSARISFTLLAALQALLTGFATDWAAARDSRLLSIVLADQTDSAESLSEAIKALYPVAMDAFSLYSCGSLEDVEKGSSVDLDAGVGRHVRRGPFLAFVAALKLPTEGVEILFLTASRELPLSRTALLPERVLTAPDWLAALVALAHKSYVEVRGLVCAFSTALPS